MSRQILLYQKTYIIKYKIQDIKEKSKISDKVIRSAESGSTEEFLPSGLHFQYSSVCSRKLWYYHHRISLIRETQSLKSGKYDDKNTFKNRTSARHLGPINPDIREGGDIVEVKPSSSQETAAKLQLLYYLWYYKYICNITKKGIISVPSEKKREQVVLTTELEDRVESQMEEIYSIINLESPPELEKKPICDSCCYQDLCWKGGESYE